MQKVIGMKLARLERDSGDSLMNGIFLCAMHGGKDFGVFFGRTSREKFLV